METILSIYTSVSVYLITHAKFFTRDHYTPSGSSTAPTIGIRLAWHTAHGTQHDECATSANLHEHHYLFTLLLVCSLICFINGLKYEFGLRVAVEL